jgi:hypothetical protein
MVQLSATSCSCIAILWVSLVSFAAITLCVASQRLFVSISIQCGNFWVHPRTSVPPVELEPTFPMSECPKTICTLRGVDTKKGLNYNIRYFIKYIIFSKWLFLWRICCYTDIMVCSRQLPCFNRILQLCNSRARITKFAHRCIWGTFPMGNFWTN